MFFRRLPLEHETALYLLAGTLDFLLTAFILPREGFCEANPVAVRVLAFWGIRGLLVFKFVAIAAVCLLSQAVALRRPAAACTLLNTATLLTVAVILYTLTLLHRAALGTM